MWEKNVSLSVGFHLSLSRISLEKMLGKDTRENRECKLYKPAYKNLVELYWTTGHTPPCPRSILFQKEVHYWVAKQPPVEQKKSKCRNMRE
jgi:hypothetical protein